MVGDRAMLETEKCAGLHSRFNPCTVPFHLLEQTFVQREGQAERLLSLIRDSATSDSKHHILLVGPRGIGKTHLMSIVYGRLQRLQGITDRIEIARLAEDEWGIASFLDLLIK